MTMLQGIITNTTCAELERGGVAKCEGLLSECPNAPYVAHFESSTYLQRSTSYCRLAASPSFLLQDAATPYKIVLWSWSFLPVVRMYRLEDCYQ